MCVLESVLLPSKKDFLSIQFTVFKGLVIMKIICFHQSKVHIEYIKLLFQIISFHRGKINIEYLKLTHLVCHSTLQCKNIIENRSGVAGAFLGTLFLTKLLTHKTPFYQLPLAVSIRAATTLLSRFGSENKNFNTHIIHVS